MSWSWVASAADIDLQVPSYTWTPDPVINGGVVAFTITAQNNGPATSGAGTLTVALPSNVNYVVNSALINGVPGCSFAAGTLTCSISPLALGQTATVTYNATGNGSGVQNTTAHLLETVVVNNDTNTSNDALIKSVTSIKGADLVPTHTGPGGCTAGCTTTAGANISYDVTTNNNGPDSATTFELVYNLPAAVDFVFASATGVGWTCPAPAGTTLTCSYSGAHIPSGGSAAPITLSGQVITSAGSITSGASVASTDSATGDPNAGNNGPVLRVVSVTPGTDLRANKSMVSSANGITTLVSAEAVTLTLSVTNNGTQQATGVTVTDAVPGDFSIGALPGGCSSVAQNITCTVGTLNAGATSASFVIPLTVTGAVGTTSTNTANVARVAPVGGSNIPAITGYSISNPFVQLVITKTKVPQIDNSPGGNDPVLTGQKIVNTVVVTNSPTSTSAATGTVTVIETLNSFPNETFDAASPGWSCTAGIPAANQVTCTHAIVGSIARGANLPALLFTTNAVGAGMNLSNEACTGGNLSAHVPADIDNIPECSGVQTIFSAPGDVDIGITKAVDDNNIATNETTFTYTLVVTNYSGTTAAPTVVVTDDIPMYYNLPSAAGTTPVTPTLVGQGAGESCSVTSANGNVSCTIKNLGAGASRTITIQVQRPVLDGVFTNTATWDSPDVVQTSNVQPDSATANVTISSLADVTVTNIADAPDPVLVGTNLSYTTSIKNNGPSIAVGVVLRHTIDPVKMSYVAGTAALTGAGGSCAFVASFAGAPHAGLAGIECSGFSLINDESRQLTFKVIPNYSFYNLGNGHAPPEAYSSDASITTTTIESNSGNNTANNIANINAQQIDIAVTKHEALGYDPDGTGQNLLHDPVAFGDQIKYLITFRNNGPSLATQVLATDVLTPPPGWTGQFMSVSLDASSTYTPTNGISCSVTSGATPGTSASPQGLTCYLSAGAGDISNSILPSGKIVTLLMTFQTGGTDPPGSITYSNHATVESAETGVAPYVNDTLAGNNTVTETTTVLPKTDLYVVKAASAGVDGNGSPYNINETFNYVLTVGNKGPSSAPGMRVSDTLPAGLVAVGNATAVVGSGVSLSSNTCHNVAWTGSCDLGPMLADVTGVDSTKQVVITIPVRALHPFAGALNSNILNTATVAPIGGASIDPVATNNTSSVNVQIQASSIAGSVYGDDDRDDVFDAGEHINVVSIKLTGTDIYGNTFGIGGTPTFPAITTTTAGAGAFLFSKLPPGTWSVIETQPAGTFDRFEAAGSSGGTIPIATCDGVANCSNAAAHNTISAINLATATAATGYVFQEYRQASVSGFVYHDANNNGLRSAETGISGINVKLTGTSYNGQAESLTLATNGSGQYNFASVPPSENVTGYTVEEQTQPAGYLDAQEQNGAGVVVASTANRAAPESFVIGVLNPNATLTERNFGELLPAVISGFVFLDGDTDAVRDAGELAGITGLTITLTGTDDLGAVGPLTATTGAGGAYSFSNLRPGTYSVVETVPTGLTHTGAQAGSKGASGQAAGTPLVGAGVTSLTTITVAAGDSATDNNFGESGQGISGFVYADLNNNGIKDAGEPGIPGIQITISGTASNGVDVCTVINPNPCTLTTDVNGAYLFSGLPASNGAGYTLTEQSQVSVPLSNYADGTDTIGAGIAIPGSGANDVLSSIKLVVGELGLNYNFGEIASSLAGRVYYDADNNGSFNGAESGLSGITITLSGTTLSGANVCTVMAAAYPTCAVSTLADGTYSFAGLPAGTYTLTETQPNDYSDRTTSVGSSGGTATGTAVSSIVLNAGVVGINYLFGEKTGAISGVAYADTNNNGVQDMGETGISGVTLTLSGTTASGANLCTTTALHPNPCNVTTDGSGNYSFTGLRNANGTGYTVTETQPVGYQDGIDTKGNINAVACAACSVAVNDVISAIPFDAANTHTVFNFGELLAANISGHVYHDANNNSTLDTGEAMAGVTVTLTGTDDLGNAVNTPSTTAADGSYSFLSLRPANGAGYTLTETQPAGISEFPTTTGTLVGTINTVTSGTAALNVISSIPLASGNSAINYDFREQASTIAGFVYGDSDDDGLKSGVEAGIAGVTVLLKNAAGTVTIATATTDATGAFRFTGLPAATYVLEETPPAGYTDGKETDGSIGGGVVDNSAFDNTPTHNRISNIVLPVTTNATNYLFGEKGGSLNGFVYVDANNNGLKEGGETPIQNVLITLSGTVLAGGIDICTIRASCTTTTDATGAFSFAGLPPGTYKLVEDQTIVAPLYNDGKETVGVAGGTPDNSAVGTNPGYNTISNIVITAANTTANAGSIGGYLFGETTLSNAVGLVPPIISGYVYRDQNHDRSRDPALPDPNAEGWTVTLTGAKTGGGTEVVCTVQTDATGFYHLDNLNCAANYPQWAGGLPISGQASPLGGGNYTTFNVSFAKTGSGITTVPQSGGNAGTVNSTVGEIANLTLHAGDNITEQNLPLDPSGVVYDAITRQPVSGAVVRIFNNGALLPGACLVSGQNTITTGANGFYQYLLIVGNPGCPLVASAVPQAFTLGVTPPAGYAPGVSTIIPPNAGAFGSVAPATFGGIDPIQAQGTAPTGGNPTTYFLSFNLTLNVTLAGSSSNVVNNHIPIDPVNAGLIVMIKTTPLVNVAKGDLVPYTVTAINTTAALLANINVVDLMPPGFKYRKGSATLNGVALEPTVSGRQLTWANQTFTANERKLWRLLLTVGVGVNEGEYTNQADALNSLTNGLVSNVANATVRVVPDPTFDCSDIIGKVFDDTNANGYQDEGEPGIPDVRIATPRGLLVATDAEGRFHIACAEIPQTDHGTNFVMKLDERTLPSGYRITTENPRDVRTTRGKMVKLNFGASLHRVVRLDVTDGAFVAGSNGLKPEWQQQWLGLPDMLKQKPSVLRLAYKVGADGKALAESRLKAISAQLQALWQAKACCHTLLIEEEIVTSPAGEVK